MFLDTVKTQQQQKIKEPSESRVLITESLELQTDVFPLDHLNVPIAVKLFNCYNVMRRNIKTKPFRVTSFEQSRFCSINLTSTINGISQFLILIRKKYTA